MTTRFHESEPGVWTRCRSVALDDDGHFICPLGRALTRDEISALGFKVIERRVRNGEVSDSIINPRQDDGNFTTVSPTNQVRVRDSSGRIVTSVSRRKPKKVNAEALKTD